jgi:hypothetical protein
METRSITDDVTGKPLTEPAKVKIMIGDVTGELDLSPESHTALISLASGHGSGELAALLATLAPVTVKPARGRTAGGKRSGDSATDPDTGMTAEEMRAWGREHGHAVNERGRVPKDVKAAILAARGTVAKPAPVASADASGKPAGNPANVTVAPAQSDAKPAPVASADASGKPANVTVAPAPGASADASGKPAGKPATVK